jgi:DNA polymerase III subunit gamma/tau
MKASLSIRARPEVLEEVVGQDRSVRQVREALSSEDPPRAWMLAGPYGTGKTTMARIIAKSIMCRERSRETGAACGHCTSCIQISTRENVDLIEYDSAQFGQVDDIRDKLVPFLSTAPSMSARKVVIIDEAQGMSSKACTALLKILEEPPEHATVILATTEPEKVDSAVRSRCRKIYLDKIDSESLRDGLLQAIDTVSNEMYCNEAAPEALVSIAAEADGAMRNALNLLEQVDDYKRSINSNRYISEEDVKNAIGTNSSAIWVSDVINAAVCNDETERNRFLSASVDHTRGVSGRDACTRLMRIAGLALSRKMDPDKITGNVRTGAFKRDEDYASDLARRLPVSDICRMVRAMADESTRMQSDAMLDSVGVLEVVLAFVDPACDPNSMMVTVDSEGSARLASLDDVKALKREVTSLRQQIKKQTEVLQQMALRIAERS